MVLLLERVFVSWSLAIDERAGHKDLRGSGRRSVILYVHRRIELYCSSLYKPESAYLSVGLDRPIFSTAGLDRPLFLTPVKRCLPGPFIAQGRIVIIRPGGPTSGPEVVETLYNI
jgi:hypothetical protein